MTSRLLARGRADDSEDTVRNRFDVYQSQTAPLLDIYGERGVVSHVNGLGELDDVTNRILDSLGQVRDIKHSAEPQARS